MEKLIEIAKIVTKYRLKKIDMLSPKGGKTGNKYLAVTDSLAKGNITSVPEMAVIAGLNERSGNFHVFKMRLFDKLLNSLLFLDLDERKYHSYGMAISDCNRNLFCIRILLLLSARQASTFIASKTLKKALKFELADVVLFCARHLRTHYSLSGDTKNFEFYNKLVKQYHKVLAREDLSAEYLESINVIGVNSNTSEKEYIEIARNCFQQIKPLFEAYPTYQISLNYYRIKGLTEFLQRDYGSAIITWNEFDAFIEKYKHFDYDNRIGESELNKMDCYLHMRDFKDGSDCAINCDKLFKPYSNNWFIFKEYYLILAIHTHNYTKAAETVIAVIDSDHFSQLTNNRQEKWRIFEAYLYILWKSESAKGLSFKEKVVRLRLNRFLNNTPIFSKDKKGYNVSILVIQILYFFIERNFISLSDKIDALERYVYRYFDENKDYRSYTFLKMIIEVERASFQLNKAQEKIALLQSKLHSTQFSYISGPEGIEIVPFTDLWEIVLTCLT